MEALLKKGIEEEMQKYIPLVEKEMERILNSGVSLGIRKILSYQIASGGKRLRPLLCIFSYRLLGGEKEEEILSAAAGIEILHNYTLIIDDIIDKSVIRRGKPTFWKKYGKSIAECLAVDYGASVFQAALLTKKPKEISQIFSQTMKTIVEGEILDILFEQRGREDERFVVENRYKEISLEHYMRMIREKSGCLIRASCEIGAVLANSSEKEKNLLGDYGENLGIAFQIRDDILDIFGKKTQFGKEIGRDIKDRKLGNIVLNFAFRELSLKEVKKIKSIFQKEMISTDEVEEIISLIEKTSAKEKSQKLGEKYIEKAKKSLKDLPDNKWKRYLLGIADFVGERNR